MLLEDLARDLVEVTSQLVGGRTINIMDTDGIIIASTDKARVGTLHQGAREAARTGKPVIIEKDQVARYPGAKEGYNMPLRLNGSIIGVVGIYGEPADIQYMAHLLEVYVAKCYQMEAILLSRMASDELRERALASLLSPSPQAGADARSLLESLQMAFAFPVTVAVVSPREGVVLSEEKERLIRQMTQRRLLRPDRDLWGTADDKLVLVVSGQVLPAALRKQEPPKFLADYRVSLSAPCAGQEDIRRGYRQAVALDASLPGPVNDMARVPHRCAYMLYATARSEGEFLDELGEKLQAAFPAEERKTLLETAETYYDMERSVGKAAAALFIHKNTLQYRVRRLLEALELTRCAPFQQEYLIRLLLERQKG